MSNKLTFNRCVTTRVYNNETRAYDTVTGFVELTVHVDQLFHQYAGKAIKSKAGRSRQASGGLVFKHVKK